MKPSYGKYLFVFVITAMIFGLAFLLSGFMTQKRLTDIRSIQDTLTVDLLSNETRFALLADSSSCATDGSAPDLLLTEMASLGDRLTYMEEHQPANSEEVVQLKKYYSLLQIKDYLLTKQITEKCGEQFATILYFYNQNCDDCKAEGALLTALREKYPFVRVYSFDTGLDTSAVQTLVSVFKVTETPTLIVQGKKKVTGLVEATSLDALVPTSLKEQYKKDLQATEQKALKEKAAAADRKSVV